MKAALPPFKINSAQTKLVPGQSLAVGHAATANDPPFLPLLLPKPAQDSRLQNW